MVKISKGFTNVAVVPHRRLIIVLCIFKKGDCMTKALLFMLGIVLIPFQVIALEKTYVCEVQQVVQLGDTGKMEKPITAYEALVGQSFVVNRTTGTLDGTVSWLKTTEFERVTIISDGRHKNDFKSISIARPPTALAVYLHIHVVGSGKTKPFYLATGDLIMAGICR